VPVSVLQHLAYEGCTEIPRRGKRLSQGRVDILPPPRKERLAQLLKGIGASTDQGDKPALWGSDDTEGIVIGSRMPSKPIAGHVDRIDPGVRLRLVPGVSVNVTR
jgi:hypothetical protein